MFTSLKTNPGGSISLLIFLLTSLTVIPQEKMKEPSVDKSIRYGKLENGFTYYIKHLSAPQSKTYLRFLSKAGTNQDDPDQLNAAHAIEHLAFKATEEFPEGIINNAEIQKLGISVYDMLAFSGPKGVNYYFDVPSGNKEALEAGLRSFKDLAIGLKLTDKDINSVRGELRQEHILRNEDLDWSAAKSRLTASIFPCWSDTSDFFDYHETFDPEVLRRFYHDWYRPDLLALSVVGNIRDIDVLEKRIREIFSGIEPSKRPRNLRNCDSLYFDQPPQFQVTSRPVSFTNGPDTRVDLQLVYRDPLTKNNIFNMKGQERLLFLKILIATLNKRFKELDSFPSLQVNARNIYYYYNLPVGLSIEGSTKGRIEKDLFQKIMKPILQLQRFGVSQTEWEEIKQKQLELLRAEQDKGARYWMDEIREHFLLNEPLSDNKHNRLKNWLSGVTVQVFHEYLHRFLKKVPEDLGFILPKDYPAANFTEDKVRSWIKEQYLEPVEPYTPPAIPSHLPSIKEMERFQENSITKKKKGSTGAEELVLSNGLKLVIKPLKPAPGMNQDKIMIHGFTRKGANYFRDKDFFTAVHIPRIVNALGVGGISKAALDRFLQNQGLIPGVVSPYVGGLDAGIQATSTPENLETVLHLIYLYMTRPNNDSMAFKKWKKKSQQIPKKIHHLDFLNAQRSLTGDSVLEEFFGEKYLPNSSFLIDGVGQIELNRAIEIHKQIFSNARDFTFVVSGDLQINDILPIFQKYLGKLPNSAGYYTGGAKRHCQNVLSNGRITFNISPPQNTEMKNVKFGLKYLKIAENRLNWKEQLKVEALGFMTKHKMWALRLRKGYAIYGVNVHGSYNERTNRYEISSYLECRPEEFSAIRTEVYQLISDLRKKEVTEESFSVGMKRMYALYNAEKRGSTHRVRHQSLYKHFRYGQPWIDPVEAENFVKSLTPMDIMEVAQTYFKDENFYEFVMQKDKSRS